MKEERQQFLEKLLAKEVEKLRLIVFPYKRRPLLDNPIEIVEEKLEGDTIGQATKEKIEGRNIEYYYKHKIKVHSKLLDHYFNIKRFKNWHKADIIEVIQHELLHCFTEDYYSIWSELDNVSADASPIFLALIEHFNFYTSHKCWGYFVGSKVYKDVKEMKTWKEVDVYLTKLLLRYNKTARELKEEDNYYNNIKLNFAVRDYKLVPLVGNVNDVMCKDLKNKLRKINISDKIFNVGCNVLPEDIAERIKDFTIEDFKVGTYKKTYLLQQGKMIDVINKEYKNKSIELKN